MKNNIFILLLGVLLFTSCVPYKNTVYMQGELDKAKKSVSIYKVQKNDILYVQIASPDENIQKLFNAGNQRTATQNMSNQTLYFKGYMVNDQGKITLPYIGEMPAEGLSFDQIKKNIEKVLLSKKFKTVDNVFITVKLAGVPYTILGEIKNPQVSVIYKENPTVFDIIAASGDITTVGNRKEVIVVRKENGVDVKSTIDLTSAESMQSPYYYIRPNDIVYVQPLRQKSLGTGTTLLQTVRDTVMALSLISSIILLAQYSK